MKYPWILAGMSGGMESSAEIIGFWAVSTMSHYFAICFTDLFADKQRNPSNIIIYMMALDYLIFFHPVPKLIQRGASNVEVFAQAAMAKLNRWMRCH